MYESNSEQLRAQLAAAPKQPGVYHFRDADGVTLYIGKAVNLFNRSRSYFLNYRKLDPRLQLMVEAADSVEYVTVENELEALLLEANLIKKYEPRYNVRMTDDKTYIWVKVFTQMDYPTVRIVRKRLSDGADYFGPYPETTPVRRMLRNLRKLFPYRTCDGKLILLEDGSVSPTENKPCFYYHLGLCSGACIGKQSREDYRKIINALKQFLRSEHKDLKQQLRGQMEAFSEARQYEDAALVRDQLRDLEYISQPSRIDDQMDEIELKQLEGNAVQLLVKELTQLGFNFGTPEELASEEYAQQFKAECYDISNIQGTNAVAAMTVAVGGKLQRQLYRKFKIKTKDTPDDFAMLQETLTRRFSHFLDSEKLAKPDESFNQLPQLLVIDGGKGQLSAVMQILAELWPQLPLPAGMTEIPVIGLAKKLEEIIYLRNGEFGSLKLRRRSPALKMLQRLRDEAHRFGITYHRKLRQHGMTASALDEIVGVGEVTKKRLIQAFGSSAGVKRAGIAEIRAIVRNKKLADQIKAALRTK